MAHRATAPRRRPCRLGVAGLVGLLLATMLGLGPVTGQGVAPATPTGAAAFVGTWLTTVSPRGRAAALAHDLRRRRHAHRLPSARQPGAHRRRCLAHRFQHRAGRVGVDRGAHHCDRRRVLADRSRWARARQSNHPGYGPARARWADLQRRGHVDRERSAGARPGDLHRDRAGHAAHARDPIAPFSRGVGAVVTAGNGGTRPSARQGDADPERSRSTPTSACPAILVAPRTALRAWTWRAGDAPWRTSGRTQREPTHQPGGDASVRRRRDHERRDAGRGAATATDSPSRSSHGTCAASRSSPCCC